MKPNYTGILTRAARLFESFLTASAMFQISQFPRKQVVINSSLESSVAFETWLSPFSKAWNKLG